MNSLAFPFTCIHPSTDDERRAPMGLADSDRCRHCRGPILRTDTVGLCWSCMPTI